MKQNSDHFFFWHEESVILFSSVTKISLENFIVGLFIVIGHSLPLFPKKKKGLILEKKYYVMYAVDLKCELLYEISNNLNYIDHRSNPFFYFL